MCLDDCIKYPASREHAKEALELTTRWAKRCNMTLQEGIASLDLAVSMPPSLFGIVQGGMFGKGPGNSTQRNLLPHPYSDFIYAIIIEEYGSLIGGALMVALYLWLFFRAGLIVRRSRSTYGAFLAYGLSLGLVLQAFVNMAVAVGLVPVTGQTLPLVSMGGSSIFFTSLATGMILSVSWGSKQDAARARAEGEKKESEAGEEWDSADVGELVDDGIAGMDARKKTEFEVHG